jgi:hypothetical protein
MIRRLQKQTTLLGTFPAAMLLRGKGTLPVLPVNMTMCYFLS